jgi:D-lactate dehydrogenase
MKITAYEVRDDEKATLEKRAGELGVELTIYSGTLNAATLPNAKGSDAVSSLGQSLYNAELLHQLKELGVKVVSTRTVGYDHIDLAAAKKEGIHVFNASYPADGVAEFTIMMMLIALRNYKASLYRANANDYSLGGLLGRELHNLTVGIIGTGRIGRRVAEILKGFGSKVLAYDTVRSDASLTYVALDEIYRESDIITLHVPLTNETRHMVNADSIAKMKNGVVLINCARGSLAKIDDLIRGIETKKIGALGLDVIEDEEGIYHTDRRSDILINRNMAYIRQFPNVTLTQHMAFYTDVDTRDMALCGINTVYNFLTKGDTRNQVV